MNWKQCFFSEPIQLLAIIAAGLTLLIAGCSSPPPASVPPPPSQPPPGQSVPPPSAQAPMAPAPPLTPDQMASLCQASPETCRRVQTAQPLNVGDVKVMAKVGFSPGVIIAQLRNSHTVFHLTANAIIDLKNSGVTEDVIDFLISTPSSIAGSMPVPEPPPNSYTSQTPPPPPPPETPPPAPGPDYAWVDGDWVWNGGWVWVGGHWVLPPYPGAVWFHGGWRRGWGGGFHRDRGHWR